MNHFRDPMTWCCKHLDHQVNFSLETPYTNLWSHLHTVSQFQFRTRAARTFGSFSSAGRPHFWILFAPGPRALLDYSGQTERPIVHRLLLSCCLPRSAPGQLRVQQYIGTASMACGADPPK